jgi:hypothetical protein
MPLLQVGYSASFFLAIISVTYPTKTINMVSLYTQKIRQNADLVNPMSKCPFGEPAAECPFTPYYEMKNEREQVAQIEVIPQEKLDELRRFHRTGCMN